MVNLITLYFFDASEVSSFKLSVQRASSPLVPPFYFVAMLDAVYIVLAQLLALIGVQSVFLNIILARSDLLNRFTSNEREFTFPPIFALRLCQRQSVRRILGWKGLLVLTCRLGQLFFLVHYHFNSRT